MIFYTPDLLARFGSGDLIVARIAREALERNADQYVASLEAIQHKLPLRFTELQKRFYLHDSRILGPALPHSHRGQFLPPPSFILILHLDPPPQEFVVLHYRSARIEEMRHHPGLHEEDFAPLEWLHDEIEVVHSDEDLEFRHSILFTHGLELQIRFRDFDFATLSPLEKLVESLAH